MIYEYSCPNCGAPVEQDARYCSECPTDLSSQGVLTRRYSPEETRAFTTRSLAPQQPQGISRTYLLLALLAALAVLLVGIILGSRLRRSPQSASNDIPLIEATEAPQVAAAAACVVPDIVGHDQSAAEGLIAGVGLQSAKSVAYNKDVAAGQVVSQDPSGGTQMEGCQGNVTFVVSLGAEPVPTVIPTPTDAPVQPTPTVEPPTPTTAPPTATLMPPIYEADFSSDASGWGGLAGQRWAACLHMTVPG